MKQKTLWGIRYVNKQIIKNKMIQSCEQDLLLFVRNCQKKKTKTKTKTLKQLHSLPNCMKQDRPLEHDARYIMNISYCQYLKKSSFVIHLNIYNKWMMRRFGIQKLKLCKTNLILRLRIWLIQINHDKVNKKCSYIFQKWPVTYQFCVYACFCIIFH